MPEAALPPSSPLGTLRQPALQVLANGAPVLGAVDAEVTSNNHFAADRYSVTVALSADPFMGPAFWAATDDILLEIRMALLPGPGIAAGEWQSLALGQVDLIDIDPIHGLLRLHGRDLTAAFIET